MNTNCDRLRRNKGAIKNGKKCMGDLIALLQEVPKYCALRQEVKRRTEYPLQRLDTYSLDPLSISSTPDRVAQTTHSVNLHLAKGIIQDHEIEHAIAFEIFTAEGRYGY